MLIFRIGWVVSRHAQDGESFDADSSAPTHHGLPATAVDGASGTIAKTQSMIDDRIPSLAGRSRRTIQIEAVVLLDGLRNGWGIPNEIPCQLLCTIMSHLHFKGAIQSLSMANFHPAARESGTDAVGKCDRLTVRIEPEVSSLHSGFAAILAGSKQCLCDECHFATEIDLEVAIA